jgi:hypothetical protein
MTSATVVIDFSLEGRAGPAPARSFQSSQAVQALCSRARKLA